MTPHRNLTLAGARGLIDLTWSKTIPCLGALGVSAILSGCSLFASLGDSKTATDTVPLPKRGDTDAAFDIGEEPDSSGAESPSVAESAPPEEPQSRTPNVASAWSSNPRLQTFSGRTRSMADAWSAPRTAISVASKPEVPVSETPTPAVPKVADQDPVIPQVATVPIPETVDVPVPEKSSMPTDGAKPLLSLAEFREKVFAVQKAQEAKRFRDALGIGLGAPKSEGTSGSNAADAPAIAGLRVEDPLSDAGADDRGEGVAPKAEPVTPETPGSPDSPKTKAAYQVFRWNLMETLAAAERAYWRLHFAELQFQEVEKSVGTLAGINDKARIGVLRKTRIPTDIVMTERFRGQRKISVAESDAMRTAAMSEVASFYTSASESRSLVSSRLVRTEDPVEPNPPSDAEPLIESARKNHPLYLSERMRVKDPEIPDSPESQAEIEALDARLQQRIQNALDRLQSAHEAIAKTRSEAETFAAGLDENLRNFGSGKIDLNGIAAYEKGLLAAQQAHLNARWDYQNALLDLELEVGDFLVKRGQEVPLSTLLTE